MKTDEILYELFWQGEEKAADELVLRHGDILTLYINGYLKDMHEAEDLMIESFALMFARKRPVSGAGVFGHIFTKRREIWQAEPEGNTVYYTSDWKPFLLKSRVRQLQKPVFSEMNEMVSCTKPWKN